VQDTADLILQRRTRDIKLVAVGEIGLDYQYVKSQELWNLQRKFFDEMLRAAEKLSLPVVIHSRGTAEILSLLPSYSMKGGITSRKARRQCTRAESKRSLSRRL